MYYFVNFMFLKIFTPFCLKSTTFTGNPGHLTLVRKIIGFSMRFSVKYKADVDSICEIFGLEIIFILWLALSNHGIMCDIVASTYILLLNLCFRELQNAGIEQTRGRGLRVEWWLQAHFFGQEKCDIMGIMTLSLHRHYSVMDFLLSP